MLYEYQTGPMLEKLHSGEIDVGILALPVDLDGLDRRALYDEPFVVAMPATHPLAKARVRIDDLNGETLLLLEDGHCLRDQALDVCNRLGVHEKQDFRATSLETLRQMVAAGQASRCCPNSPRTRPSHGPRPACEAVREAGAGAHDRRGLAQIDHPHRRHRWHRRDDPQRDEGRHEEMRRHLAAAVFALAISNVAAPATQPSLPAGRHRERRMGACDPARNDRGGRLPHPGRRIAGRPARRRRNAARRDGADSRRVGSGRHGAHASRPRVSTFRRTSRSRSRRKARTSC